MTMLSVKPVETANHSTTQLYHHLNDTLADSYKVIQHDASTHRLPSGSLFCLHQKNRSLLVFICHDQLHSTSLQQDNNAAIFADKMASFDQLHYFQQSLFPKKLHPHANALAPLIVIYPTSVAATTRLYLSHNGIRVFGHDALTPSILTTLVHKYMGITLSDDRLDCMLSRFNPDAVLVRQQSQTQQSRKRFCLNAEQQFALQQDLVLSADNKPPHPYNLRLIHGLAGSGKSMLLLHRAKRLQDLYPEKKTLLLTHNQAVHHYLKAQYQYLFKQENNNCYPFMAWCLQQLEWTPHFVNEDEVLDVISQIVARHFKQEELTVALFIREMGFIKDRLIFTESDYLRVDRSKQAYSFSTDMRVKLWLALLDFDTELRQRHLLLWSDLPRLLWKNMQTGAVSLEQYDHILIDEAQYFAPIWFEIIKKSIQPTVGQLFMVADPDQGFLNRSLNWKETGIDLRNRTLRLKCNYRSNPLILKVADAFRFNRRPDKTHYMLSNNTNLSTTTTTTTEEHVSPTLLHFYDERDEKNHLISEIDKLLQQGTAPRDILILDAKNSSAHSLVHTIKQSLNQSACSITEPHWDENVVRVCDLASATGIESPNVFIIGLHALFEQKNKVQLTEHEYRTLALENTRKLYMGMTRACKKLVLLLTADVIPNSLQIKEMNISKRHHRHQELPI